MHKMNSAYESDFGSDLSHSIAIQRPRICRRRGSPSGQSFSAGFVEFSGKKNGLL
jgi:hypothetical protein